VQWAKGAILGPLSAISLVGQLSLDVGTPLEYRTPEATSSLHDTTKRTRHELKKYGCPKKGLDRLGSPGFSSLSHPNRSPSSLRCTRAGHVCKDVSRVV